MRYEIWDMRYETWDMRYETWDMRYEIWDVRHEILASGGQRQKIRLKAMYNLTNKADNETEN